MMKFRTIAAQIITILGDAAASRYQVIGYQKQSIDVNNITGNNRLVEVYYNRGDFPKSGGGMSSSKKDHNMTFKVDLKCAATAKGDIATMNDPNSTPQEVAAALANIAYASKEANDLMDELFDIIYQIVMAANNIDLGLPVGIVSNRWISELQKDNPLERGSLLVLTGSCLLTCKAQEDITGDNVTAAASIDTTLDLDGDHENITGVETDPLN
jgi:hypothetical protein